MEIKQVCQSKKNKWFRTFYILIFYGGVGTLNGLLTKNDISINININNDLAQITSVSAVSAEIRSTAKL